MQLPGALERACGASNPTPVNVSGKPATPVTESKSEKKKTNERLDKLHLWAGLSWVKRGTIEDEKIRYDERRVGLIEGKTGGIPAINS